MPFPLPVSSGSRRLTESPGDCAGYDVTSVDVTSIEPKFQSVTVVVNLAHYLVVTSHDASPASLLSLTALVEEIGELLWVIPHGQRYVEEGM